MTQSPPTSTEDPAAVRRVALASLVGTTVEWYDFFIYASAAGLVFSQLFFTALDPATALLASFATIGVSFIARPLGGVIAGHLGDRLGRKRMLVATLLIMGLSTVGVGLLPTYASIGVAAPILLLVLRLLQGLSAGGEWGGAALMAVEHAPPGRRGFFGTYPQIGVPIGLILANLVFLLVSTSTTKEQFLSWGWRIPFLLSVVLVGVGLFVRARVDESPVFAKLRAQRARAVGADALGPAQPAARPARRDRAVHRQQHDRLPADRLHHVVRHPCPHAPELDDARRRDRGRGRVGRRDRLVRRVVGPGRASAGVPRSAPSPCSSGRSRSSCCSTRRRCR